MPGNLGLGLPQDLNEIADANLLIAHQVQEPETGIVSQSLKEALEIEVFALRCHEDDYIRIDEYVQWVI